ncbi:DUF397 domain-containing protein [Streptomyces sp. NBC_00669]|uniref:DUF397 domain-containing protein n=1 Tax=unclassified Streptomyces TaxID=2593676 RepID=UPI002E379640|nr:DUF397 domain-containing protein [Streptomyces sp. NBC_00669]
MADVNFETALWRKSNNSGDTGCVEVALNTPSIGVRDTKQQGTGPILSFSRSAWTSFVEGLREGDFEAEESTT